MGLRLEREVGTWKTMVEWVKGSKDRETASDRLTTKKGKQNQVYRSAHCFNPSTQESRGR